MSEDRKVKVERALRRLEGAEIKVICRGGEVVKIPAQEAETQERDGIITKYKVVADIVE